MYTDIVRQEIHHNQLKIAKQTIKKWNIKAYIIYMVGGICQH